MTFPSISEGAPAVADVWFSARSVTLVPPLSHDWTWDARILVLAFSNWNAPLLYSNDLLAKPSSRPVNAFEVP